MLSECWWVAAGLIRSFQRLHHHDLGSFAMNHSSPRKNGGWGSQPPPTYCPTRPYPVLPRPPSFAFCKLLAFVRWWTPECLGSACRSVALPSEPLSTQDLNSPAVTGRSPPYISNNRIVIVSPCTKPWCKFRWKETWWWLSQHLARSFISGVWSFAFATCIPCDLCKFPWLRYTTFTVTILYQCAKTKAHTSNGQRFV